MHSGDKRCVPKNLMVTRRYNLLFIGWYLFDCNLTVHGSTHRLGRGTETLKHIITDYELIHGKISRDYIYLVQ